MYALPFLLCSALRLVLAFALLMVVDCGLCAGEPVTPPSVEDKRKELLGRIGDPENAEALQALAAREAIALGVDDALAAALLEKISHQTSAAMAKGLIVELGRSNYTALGTKLIERWLLLPMPSRQAAVPILFTRAAWTDALLDGLFGGKIESVELTPDQVQYLLHHPEEKIAARARSFFEGRKLVPKPDRAQVLAAFNTLSEQPSDARAGAQVFDQHCARCHRFYERGTTLGPELTGAHLFETQELLEAILDPARNVGDRYKPTAHYMKDGRLLTGVVKTKNEHVVELLQIQGGSTSISTREIERTQPLTFSLMPPGFERLEKPVLANLIAFLRNRPQLFPLPLEKSATASSAKPMFVEKDLRGVFVFGRWGFHTFENVYFHVSDADGGTRKNAIVLQSAKGSISATMPKSVSVPCKSDATAIHFLAGIAGFGFPQTPAGTVSVTVRLHYADASTEDHVWKNGEQIADIAKTAEVPQSKKAFEFREQQLRYLSIKPAKPAAIIDRIEFIKGEDETAPAIFAISVERADPHAAPTPAAPPAVPNPEPTKD